MAKARPLDRRRRSIRSIRKITRTMELISRAQFKRAMDRASAATAFTRRITALVGHLVHAGLEVSHPLLAARDEMRGAVLLVLTANRGLCGGYNAGVMRLAYARYHELQQTGAKLQLEVSGKRGISALRFRKVPVDQAYTHLQEKVRYDDVDVLATRYLAAFQAGEIDRLDIVYTRFESLSRQQPVVETLLPLSELAGADATADQPGRQYDLLPSARSILDEVVPASFKVKLFKCFLDAAVSEQIARMVAMKAATENADQMIQSLSMAYNRARQGQITGELLEIIGGAEALNE